MNNTAFSDRILALPLFTGFSRLDFLDIVEKIPFDLRTYQPGDVVLQAGEQCRSLLITLTGIAEAEEENAEHSYRLTEYLPAPFMLEPERLFGLHNTYCHTLRARTELSCLRLDKNDVRSLMMERPAFQMNFYNTLCSMLQDAHTLLWWQRRESLQGRFLLFLGQRLMLPRGEKALHIKMSDLAVELGATQLKVSAMLADLREKGLVLTRRERIIIPEYSKLLRL